MEELGWDERGLGEARAKGVEAGVAVVGTKPGGEGLEELVGRGWCAEGDGRRAARGEGDCYSDGELVADAERHARNLDSACPRWKGPSVTRRYTEPRRPVKPNRMDTGHPLTASLSQTIVMRSAAANGRLTHVNVRPIGTLVRLIGGVCAVALLVGCSGSTSIRPFGGVYHLISVDGEPDPQPFYPGSATPDLVGGTLNVGPDSLDLTLSLQAVDSAGRPAGDVQELAGATPYTRHGDTLFAAGDTAGRGDALLPTEPDIPLGTIIGSSVSLTLYLPIATSTGFTIVPRHLLFTPAP
jgi:hypothetical protein